MIEAKRIKGTAQISHLYCLYFWCAHSHPFPLVNNFVTSYACEFYIHVFDRFPNTKWTLILPFTSVNKPVYLSWRNTPLSAYSLFSGLLSEERSSLSSNQPSLVFFLKSAFSPSLRGLHFAHSCLIYLLWDRIISDWRPRKPHAVYLA